jgi:hypothetical protein
VRKAKKKSSEMERAKSREARVSLETIVKSEKQSKFVDGEQWLVLPKVNLTLISAPT